MDARHKSRPERRSYHDTHMHARAMCWWVPLAALACWEGVTMAYEDGAVFAMGLAKDGRGTYLIQTYILVVA